MADDDKITQETKIDVADTNNQNESTYTFQLTDDLSRHPVNSLPPSCRRVKLYEISSSNDNWLDKGTGFCYFDGDLESKNPKLLINLEHYGTKTLVSTNIKENSDYSSQNDSIIIWQESGDLRLFRALSFQNVIGHNACWSYIRNFVDDTNMQSSGSNVSVHSSDASTNSQYRVLPSPTASSLQKLESSLETYLCQTNLSDGIYMDLLDKKWLKELFGFMYKCIINEDLNTMSAISSILLKLVLNWCGSLELMHIFVSDDVFFDLLKSFEYDMDLISQNIRMEHVKFFKKYVRHHEVIPINNSTFYQLIHANYRINYLKDVILPRHLDEFSIQRINSTVYANMTEIMNIILTEDNNFFDHLKSKLSSNYMAALFLRELLLMARSSNLVSQTDRNSLILMVRNYQLLNELNGYFDESCEACKMYKETLLPLNKQSEEYYKNVKSVLSSLKGGNEKNNTTEEASDNHSTPREGSGSDTPREDKTELINREEYRPNLLCTSRHRLIEPLSLVVEIFHTCQDIFPAIVRSAVFIDAEIYGSPKMLLGLCDVLLNVSNEGLQSQTREIISRLLDPKNMDLPEKDEICNIFYDKGVLDYLMHYLNNSTTQKPGNEGETTPKSVSAGATPKSSSSDVNSKNLADGVTVSDEYGTNSNTYIMAVDLRSDNTVDKIEMNINAKLNIMEILSLCAREHKHRFKLRVQSQKIPLKVIKSSMSPYDKFLVVGSIKFIKICIQMKDKLVNKHIIRYNILRYILWILMYKVDAYSGNGSILESACLALLAAIESTGTDSLIVYLFEDPFCLSITTKFKKYNACYNMLFTNLQRLYHTISNKNSFDENKWFEEEDDDEEEDLLVEKNKIDRDTMLEDNLITMYSTSANLMYEDSLSDKWVINKKIKIPPSINNNLVEGGINKKITVKLKNKDDRSIADEFMLDSQDVDTIN
ncbi:hypothetical protein MACK_001934 [Theileria orientalis]|uniref:Serine/threonine-protein phosphatase 4 regulatory subunit 3-like central domain-containing protein n=1 Tax=Theileria orientalis TaxID=68886 RepID=A0A976QUL5_THEOR|nr:hypothetical protein MACK_001934 [Theileria orientalis]